MKFFSVFVNAKAPTNKNKTKKAMLDKIEI
jgi:hypothetical protein